MFCGNPATEKNFQNPYSSSLFQKLDTLPHRRETNLLRRVVLTREFRGNEVGARGTVVELSSLNKEQCFVLFEDSPYRAWRCSFDWLELEPDVDDLGSTRLFPLAPAQEGSVSESAAGAGVPAPADAQTPLGVGGIATEAEFQPPSMLAPAPADSVVESAASGTSAGGRTDSPGSL